MQCQSSYFRLKSLVRDVMNSSTGVYIPVGAGTASSSVGGFNNDLNEYDCESEGDLEALVREVAAKAAPLRSSSKEAGLPRSIIRLKRRVMTAVAAATQVAAKMGGLQVLCQKPQRQSGAAWTI
ncbi:hypothetical protein AAG906_010650 [Vitis piasezkii]